MHITSRDGRTLLISRLRSILRILIGFGVWPQSRTRSNLEVALVGDLGGLSLAQLLVGPTKVGRKANDHLRSVGRINGRLIFIKYAAQRAHIDVGLREITGIRTTSPRRASDALLQ